MDARKNWTAQQDKLRKTLSARAHFDEGMLLFLSQHAAVHASEISGGAAWSLHDEVLADLTDTQIRTVPGPGKNSIAWLLWHITRIEDMTMNTLVFEQPQVWCPAQAVKLGFSRPDCGASMDEQEVTEFSTQISASALLDYRAAVGRQTRETIQKLSADQAREIVPTSAVQKLVDEGSISAKGNWLFEYYTNRSKSFFLTRTATSHNFIHLNEAGRVREKITRI